MADRAATCAGCGCGCDDIEVTVGAEALERVTGTCRLGDAWFEERAADAPPAARVDGRQVDVAEAIDVSAAILSEARFPLVCGLQATDCESLRAAVALAEAIGAVIDPVGPSDAGVAAAAAQAFGLSTATFGDVRDRAEVVVAWRADPVATHPRLLPRLRLERDSGRTLVVIDAERTDTADEADVFIELPPELDFEALWAMRALARDLPLDRERTSQLPLDALAELAGRLRECSYGAVLYGSGLAGGYANVLALLALVRDLAATAHVVALPLRGGNARGAEDVLAWQTGYPSAVSFARGYPRAQPGEFSAAGVLERGDADAALIVGFDALAHLPPRAADHVRRIPTIVVGPRATETAAAARVAFGTAAGGVYREGTVHRMDGVPVPLRAPLASSRLGDGDVLAGIAARLAGDEGS